MSKIRKKIHKNLYRNSLVFADYTTDVEYCFYDESPYAILLIPPHPQWGGSMYTPMVDQIFNDLDNKRIDTMRFSFSKFPIFNHNYNKYITQAAICLEELLKITNNKKKIWLVGLSFGSLVALNLSLRRPELSGVVLVSPPILHYDFISWYIPFKTNLLVAYGNNDSLTPSNVMKDYITYLNNNKMQAESKIFNTNHTFSKKEEDLSNYIVKFIEKQHKK